MKLFKFLTVLFLAGVMFSGCAGMQLKKEAALVPAGHMRITLINDIDVLMCYNTVWLNHNVPGILGPTLVCGGEIQPGVSYSFDRNIASWHFKGPRVYNTSWYQCRAYQSDKKYNSEVVFEIPEDTAIIKIYTKHYEIIPR